MRGRCLYFLDFSKILKTFLFFFFPLVSIIVVSPLKSSELDSGNWWGWANNHRRGGHHIAIPCQFGSFKFEAPDVMREGKIYRITIRGKFSKAPSGPIKVRAIWHFSNKGPILNIGDQVHDYILGPDDSLIVSTSVKIVHLQAGYQSICYIFAERPEKDEYVNKVCGDYWFGIGGAVRFWEANPSDNTLVYRPLRRNVRTEPEDTESIARRQLKNRIDSAGQDIRLVSSEAKQIIDIFVPSLDETRKRKLAEVAEYLSEQNESSLQTAAEFIGRHARDWGKPNDCGTVAKAADKLIWLLEIGELVSLYRNTVEASECPTVEIWQYVRDAREGRRGWLEVERKLDSLLIQYPDDEDLNATTGAIRAMIEENNE